MKTEVYSWRVSTDVKSSLEREARSRKISLASVLDLAAREWLSKASAANDGDKEQIRLQKAAFKCFGAFEGHDPHRSEKVREVVRERLRERYGR